MCKSILLSLSLPLTGVIHPEPGLLESPKSCESRFGVDTILDFRDFRSSSLEYNASENPLLGTEESSCFEGVDWGTRALGIISIGGMTHFRLPRGSLDWAWEGTGAREPLDRDEWRLLERVRERLRLRGRETDSNISLISGEEGLKPGLFWEMEGNSVSSFSCGDGKLGRGFNIRRLDLRRAEELMILEPDSADSEPRGSWEVTTEIL